LEVVGSLLATTGNNPIVAAINDNSAEDRRIFLQMLEELARLRARTDEQAAEIETPPAVSEECKAACDKACVWRKNMGGGGVFAMILFNSHGTDLGDYEGPSVWVGGRGYTYLGENHEWRVGGLGAGGGSTDETRQQTGNRLYPFSEKRTVSGGYGGVTAEYVLRAGTGVEFPMGLLVGGGGGGFESVLTPRTGDLSGIDHVNRKSSGFLALQPMVGIEANILYWLKAGVGLSYLFAEPFSSDRYISGFSMTFGLFFGQFEEPVFEW
ncbi:MAG: hypothetical protein C4523_20070, partial [Myxococcales bacterium]